MGLGQFYEKILQVWAGSFTDWQKNYENLPDKVKKNWQKLELMVIVLDLPLSCFPLSVWLSVSHSGTHTTTTLAYSNKNPSLCACGHSHYSFSLYPEAGLDWLYTDRGLRLVWHGIPTWEKYLCTFKRCKQYFMNDSVLLEGCSTYSILCMCAVIWQCSPSSVF